MALKLIKDIEQAKQLLIEYPWFDAPCRFMAEAEGSALPVRIAISDRMRPHLNCERYVAEIEKEDEGFSVSMSIIDEFIGKGDYRIITNDSTPDDISLPEDKLMPDDDLLTEELAEVYLSQGLKSDAIEIYRRLSLLNPEKSVYFASIIEKAELLHAKEKQ